MKCGIILLYNNMFGVNYNRIVIVETVMPMS